jgi:hypothetical protein
MAEFEIFDNFLEKDAFEYLQTTIYSNSFPWYRHDGIVTDTDSDVFFAHMVYTNFQFTSNSAGIFDPIIKFLKPKALIRAKLNLYVRTNQVEKHDMHTDWEYPHKGALFYVNTNNGTTTLDDGTEINSIANRLLLFDSTKPHCSSSCSDEPHRITFAVNYF